MARDELCMMPRSGPASLAGLMMASAAPSLEGLSAARTAGYGWPLARNSRVAVRWS